MSARTTIVFLAFLALLCSINAADNHVCSSIEACVKQIGGVSDIPGIIPCLKKAVGLRKTPPEPYVIPPAQNLDELCRGVVDCVNKYNGILETPFLIGCLTKELIN